MYQHYVACLLCGCHFHPDRPPLPCPLFAFPSPTLCGRLLWMCSKDIIIMCIANLLVCMVIASGILHDIWGHLKQDICMLPSVNCSLIRYVGDPR